MRITIGCLLLALLVGGCTSSGGTATSRPSASWVVAPHERVEAWTADIDALARELPRRHKNAFFRCKRQDFEAAAAQLRQDVPNLTDSAVVVGMMKLAAMLGDAHTSVSVWDVKPEIRRFPIEIYNFKEGPTIVAAGESQRDLIGCELLTVGGLPVEEAFVRVSKVAAFENEATYKSNVARDLPYVEIAQALGLTDEHERLTIEVRAADGLVRTVVLSPRAAGEKVARAAFDPAKLPISRRPHDRVNWFESIPERRAIYFRYNSCNDEEVRPVSKVCDGVLAAIDADKPERLIVDLRGNSGGNSSLIHPLLWGLKWRSWFGGKIQVYCLIGRYTFSSAFMNAQELKDHLGATLVGEPTGQKPNAYGEVKTFELPRSHITVRYSTEYWRRVKGDPDSLEPDIRIDETAANYFEANDAALETACRNR